MSKKTVSESFKSIDIFGKQMTFYVDGKAKHKTFCGAIASIVYFFIVLVYLLFTLVYLVS
jgi:hypothetical protein